MASTTNYGWTTPDDTSLVKDGADAIRTLGSSVDDSLWYSGYGQAGKNKIINGDFSINQRNFTTTPANSEYCFDRFFCPYSDGTVTFTPQTFTPGAAPVAGYEAKNYIRITTTGQTLSSALASLSQRIESGRTFAGQTITVSFFAKANSGTPKIAVDLGQSFGTGGSPSTAVNTYAGDVTLSTSWARYSVTVALPSVSGKTFGTTQDGNLRLNLWVSAGSDYNARTGSLGIQSNTFDIWGVQVEAGDFATPFQTASGGSPQAELAACMRYYQRNTGTAANAFALLSTPGFATSTSAALIPLAMQIPLRTTATSCDFSTLRLNNGAAAFSLTNVTIDGTSVPNLTVLNVSGTATIVPGSLYMLQANNSTTAFVGFSAEL
jgi:hypothetical protein